MKSHMEEARMQLGDFKLRENEYLCSHKWWKNVWDEVDADIQKELCLQLLNSLSISGTLYTRNLFPLY